MENSKEIPDYENLPKSTRDQIDKQVAFGKIIAETKKDLETNPKYKEFFSQYHPASVQSFIVDYAERKARYLSWGEFYTRWEEDNNLQFYDEAQQRLWEIQQKKLFNLQCQWRAEAIDVPEIETTVDFVYWESDIENCPFLEPITEEEIELYISYVLSNDFQEELHWLSNWQDYTEYKNNYTRDDDETIIIPEWYMFYDGRKGTSGLMSLPDVRGEKEKVYIDLVRNKSRIEREKKAAETPPSKPDTRPYISFADMRIIEDFIKQFEEPKLLKYFRVVERNLTSEKEEEVEQAFEFLKRVPDLVEIESNDDWRDGIIKAAKKCQRTFLANELENAFREYRNRIDIGIPFEPHLDKQYRDSMKELAKSHKQNLIEGRILNGEPGDLDF